MGLRILVVEDQADIQLTLRLALEVDGYEVVAAENAADALAALEQATPDLMLLDVTLPRVSGWDLLASIRRDERFGALPIIILSALPGDQVRRRAAELGATDHLEKPFDVRTLERIVERALGGRGS